MLETLVLTSILFDLLLFAAAASADYYLTIVGARLYKNSVSKTIQYEKGYEVNPTFQAEINALKLYSPIFIRQTLLTLGFLFLIYYLFIESFPDYFLFLYGLLLWPRISVNLRHLSNIWEFTNLYNKKPKGVSGEIKFKEWHSQKQVAYRMFFNESLLFFLVFLFTGSYLFLGGAVGTALDSRYFAKLAKPEGKRKDSRLDAKARKK